MLRVAIESFTINNYMRVDREDNTVSYSCQLWVFVDKRQTWREAVRWCKLPSWMRLWRPSNGDVSRCVHVVFTFCSRCVHVVFTVHLDINFQFFLTNKRTFYFRISVQFTLHMFRPSLCHHHGTLISSLHCSLVQLVLPQFCKQWSELINVPLMMAESRPKHM
jgi:hypothetical protein